ncbi:MAG: NAD(P)-binding protein [Bilophila sp.]
MPGALHAHQLRFAPAHPGHQAHRGPVRGPEHGGRPAPVPAPATGRRAAVIGAGPAGLSCARFLALGGVEVHLYEGKDVLGGMAGDASRRSASPTKACGATWTPSSPSA